MDQNLNKKLHGYTILSLLGEGGMAQVYYAENALKRPAAVKILKPQFAFERGIRQRFQQEAETMVKLEHPHIRSVIDYIEEDLAIIMEFLSGTDLKDYVDKLGPVPEVTVQHWLTQLLPALQYAHDKGVVHRDIKPSNIFLTTDGQIKLMDFGIAKLAGELGQTHTGQIIGSPLYMSPEQITNPKEIDWRSDMYSLGVTLYHLLSGKKPYDDSTASLFTIQMKIVQEGLPLIEHPKMNLLISKLTIKNLEGRSTSAQEILESLILPSSIYEVNSSPKEVPLELDSTVITKDPRPSSPSPLALESKTQRGIIKYKFFPKSSIAYLMMVCPFSIYSYIYNYTNNVLVYTLELSTLILGLLMMFNDISLKLKAVILMGSCLLTIAVTWAISLLYPLPFHHLLSIKFIASSLFCFLLATYTQYSFRRGLLFLIANIGLISMLNILLYLGVSNLQIAELLILVTLIHTIFVYLLIPPRLTQTHVILQSLYFPILSFFTFWGISWFFTTLIWGGWCFNQPFDLRCTWLVWALGATFTIALLLNFRQKTDQQ